MIMYSTLSATSGASPKALALRMKDPGFATEQRSLPPGADPP
jgi:hypothetical protein